MKILFFIFYFKLFLSLIGCVSKENKSNIYRLIKMPVTLKEKNNTLERIHFGNIDETIRVDIYSNINESRAIKMVEDRKSYINSFFNIYEDPYFGEPDKDVTCLKKLNLGGSQIDQKDFIRTEFLVTANQNFILMSCPKESDLYFVELTYLFCKTNNNFYDLRRFLRTSDLQKGKISYEKLCNN